MDRMLTVSESIALQYFDEAWNKRMLHAITPGNRPYFCTNVGCYTTAPKSNQLTVTSTLSSPDINRNMTMRSPSAGLGQRDTGRPRRCGDHCQHRGVIPSDEMRCNQQRTGDPQWLVLHIFSNAPSLRVRHQPGWWLSLVFHRFIKPTFHSTSSYSVSLEEPPLS